MSDDIPEAAIEAAARALLAVTDPRDWRDPLPRHAAAIILTAALPHLRVGIKASFHADGDEDEIVLIDVNDE